MDQKIMVSVICPTYNQAQYMRQGLDSILKQKTDFEIEILIGEDCSPDNTNEILGEYEKKYPGKLKVFHREQNLKQARNVYDLFMRSKGKYIIILDLDDYWTDEFKLQKQVDFLENHPEYIGTAHDFELVDAENRRIPDENHEITNFLNHAFSLQDFLDNGFVYQTGTFCYRNIWKEDKDWSILYKADDTVVDLTINSILLLRQNVFILPDSMSVYRKVIQENAKNCRSVSAKDIAGRWEKTARQYAILTAYFKGEVNYSKFWSSVVINYLKALLKREPGKYQWKKWIRMWSESSTDVKKNILQELKQSFDRRLRK